MRARTRRTVGWAAVVALLGYVAFAGGTDDNSAGGRPELERGARGSGAPVVCASGTVSGGGATFPQTIVQQWIKDYTAACPGATVTYQPIGSGAGIQQLIEGTLDFGASDAVMKPDEAQGAAARGGEVLHIPWTAGGIAVMYNLPGVKDLRLRPETLAGIFAGRIATWDDPQIRADNRDADLPGGRIQVVHRSDGSGTTMVFTSYLTAVAPGIWTAGAAKDVPWPVGQGAKGSDGVTAAVAQSEGAIGYAEVSFAEANRLGVALVRNPGGRFVGPTPAAVAAAIGNAHVPADLRIEADYTPDDPAAYPISTPTWALVWRRPRDPVEGRVIQAFLLYALTRGQDVAAPLSFAPLPRAVAVRAEAVVYGMELPE